MPTPCVSRGRQSQTAQLSISGFALGDPWAGTTHPSGHSDPSVADDLLDHRSQGPLSSKETCPSFFCGPSLSCFQPRAAQQTPSAHASPELQVAQASPALFDACGRLPARRHPLLPAPELGLYRDLAHDKTKTDDSAT